MSFTSTETHRSPECTGEWSQSPGVHPALWACDRCGARVLDEPQTRHAVITEMQIGALLARLAAEGTVLP